MIHVLRLDEQRRFEIAASAIEKLGFDFSNGSTLHSWALIGTGRQLQILPRNSRLARFRDAFSEGSAEQNFSWEASGDAEIMTLRRLYGLLRVSCRPRSRSANVRITLPSDAVHLGLFRPPQTVVIVVIGEIVEVWSAQHWQDTAAVSDLRDFTEQVQQVLE